MARASQFDRQSDPDGSGEAPRARVGDILRSARLSRDEDLRDVAAKLRIRYPYLEAIEEGRLNDLPGPTYAIGFVRAYADYLGLETEDVVARFKADGRALDGKAELVFPEPLPGSRAPGFALLFVAVVLGGLVYGGWLYVSGQDRPVADIIPAVPEELAKLIDGVSESGPANGEAAPTAPAAPPADAAGTPDGPSAAPAPDRATPDDPGPDSAPPASDPAVAASGASAGDDAAPAAPGVADSRPATPAAPAEAGAAPAETPASETTASGSAETPAGIAVDAAPDPASEAGADTAGDTTADTTADTTTETTADAAVDMTVDAAAEAAGDPATEALAEAAPETPMRSVEPAGPETSALSTPALRTGETPTADGTASAQDAASTVGGAEAADGSAAPAGARQDADQPAEAGSAVAAIPSTPDAPTPDAPTPEVSESAPTAPPPPAPSPPTPETPAVAPSATGDETGRIYGAAADRSRVALTARVASWIEVKGPDGQTLLARLLRAGETYRAPDRAGVTLVTGNAGGLEITVDGERAPDIGPLGAVRRNVALDPDKLKAGVAADG
ncbi:MAG: DUF4115 domain-containing protein [Alphaproteobacteria bacterium]|nr:DUF4115 domain-containing protein [Alphaproteobacteria bacterium]